MTRTLSVDEFRAEAARSMSERDLQEQVRQIALANGWCFFHPWRSDHSTAGYPDCHCLRGDRQVVIELKREGKDPMPAQRNWLEAFGDAGAEVYVLRPSDLLDGTIEAILRGE